MTRQELIDQIKEDYRVDDLKAELDSRGIKYAANAKEDNLAGKLADAQIEAGEVEISEEPETPPAPQTPPAPPAPQARKKQQLYPVRITHKMAAFGNGTRARGEIVGLVKPGVQDFSALLDCFKIQDREERLKAIKKVVQPANRPHTNRPVNDDELLCIFETNRCAHVAIDTSELVEE